MFIRNAGNRVSDCAVPYVMCFLWRYAAVDGQMGNNWADLFL